MEEKKEILLTQEGYQKLEDELETLKTVRRREVAERIKIAISFGDISENAEYDEAKNEQAQLEERIMKLENMIRKAVIIDESKIDSNIVTIGSIVTVNDMEFEEEVEYTIVGSTEVDLLENKISNESPLGSALLGAKKKQTVEVNAPAGIMKYKILDIKK